MVVSFSTNACGDKPDLGIVTGPTLDEAQRRVSSAELNATQTGCLGVGTMGSLTLTPGGQRGGTVVGILALRGKRPEDCMREPATPGCITARRRFTFLDHTPLTIDIPLDLDCEGKACDAFTTCSRGSCVDPLVTCEANGTCTPPLGDGGPGQDAAGPDGSVVACATLARCQGGAGCQGADQCCLESGRCGTQCGFVGCCASTFRVRRAPNVAQLRARPPAFPREAAEPGARAPTLEIAAPTRPAVSLRAPCSTLGYKAARATAWERPAPTAGSSSTSRSSRVWSRR